MLARAVQSGARPGRRSFAPLQRLRMTHRALVGLVVAAIVAALVITDLPTHATPAYQVATLRGFFSTLQGDVAPCEAGIHDALQAAVATLEGRSDIGPGVASTFTAQGVAACSFTNNSTVDLGGMAPPHTLTAPAVARVAPALGTLVYSDAFQLLQDLAYVLHRPDAARPRAQFATALDHFQRQRARIAHLVAAAARSEHADPASLPIFSPKAMLPGGRLPVRART